MTDPVAIERRHLRVRLGDEGLVSKVSPDGTNWVQGTVTVLGARGACVTLHEAIPIGTPLSLSFTLPGSTEEIHCGGVVRNQVSENDLGIEFFFMAPEDRDRLADTVTRLHLSQKDQIPSR